jgi:NAD(P)-dependent dehydrogenase (short-subunit alcohol dehydrogenase family)
MKVIRGARALVTGAASGIGRALALALAREGADLYLLDIDENGLASVALEARALGVRVITATCDLVCPVAARSAADELLQAWGGLEILVNNAGISYHGNTDTMSDEQWDRVLALNLHSPLQLTRRLLPALLSSGDAHIVNVCSVLGLAAVPRFTAYQTSKYGLVGFSESLRAEYASRGLGVTALCPGFVQTNIYRAMVDGTGGRPMRAPPRLLRASPEQVAARAIRAIYRNHGVVPVSFLANLMWRLKRWLPGLWDLANRRRCKQEPAREPAAHRDASAAA